MTATSSWLAFFIALACAFGAGFIANGKNRNVMLWSALGFVLPIVGLIIIAVLPKKALTA
jgi:hypothetical protein